MQKLGESKNLTKRIDDKIYTHQHNAEHAAKSAEQTTPW